MQEMSLSKKNLTVQQSNTLIRAYVFSTQLHVLVHLLAVDIYIHFGKYESFYKANIYAQQTLISNLIFAYTDFSVLNMEKKSVQARCTALLAQG